MRIGLMICAAVIAASGCSEAEHVPPQEVLPLDAASPPPVAPPPPKAEPFGSSRWDWCGTIVNPPIPRPSDAPTRAECDERSKRSLAELRRTSLLDDADLPDANSLTPFAGRKDPNPDRGSWIQQLQPTDTDGCSFTEKPKSARPTGPKVLASSGNMDLLGQGNLLAHDHAIGFVEAMWNADRPVIAARQGLPDLWIEPGEPWDRIVLLIGADELRCHKLDERAGG